MEPNGLHAPTTVQLQASIDGIPFTPTLLCALTRSRNHHLITSNKDNFLSSKEFLGNNRGQSTKEMIPAVDNFRLGQHHGIVFVICWMIESMTDSNDTLNGVLIACVLVSCAVRRGQSGWGRSSLIFHATTYRVYRQTVLLL